MKKFAHKIKKWFKKKLGKKSLPEWYFTDLALIIGQRANDKTFEIINRWPIVNEKYAEAGEAKGHYFHQDLLIAQKIFDNKALKHVDIGSRIDGFVAHVAAFRTIELLDIRPIKNTINNIIFRQANLLNLPSELENYCDSISSLHVIEHFV